MGSEMCIRDRYHTTPHHTIPYHIIPYHTIPYRTNTILVLYAGNTGDTPSHRTLRLLHQALLVLPTALTPSYCLTIPYSSVPYQHHTCRHRHQSSHQTPGWSYHTLLMLPAPIRSYCLPIQYHTIPYNPTVHNKHTVPCRTNTVLLHTSMHRICSHAPTGPSSNPDTTTPYQ